jgi:hypothetical protein
MNIIKEQTGYQNIIITSDNLILSDTSSIVVFKTIKNSYTALINVSPVSETSIQQETIPIVNIYTNYV